MLREDNLVIGFAIGVIVPVLAYLAIDLAFDGLAAVGVANDRGVAYGFRPRTLALVAVCCNVLPFRYYNGLRNDASTRGVFLATGIYAVAWLVIYGRALLNLD